MAEVIGRAIMAAS